MNVLDFPTGQSQDGIAARRSRDATVGVAEAPRREGGALATLAAPVRSVPRPAENLPSALSRAALCAKIAVENKGQDVLVLDMRPVTKLYDYFVIATGSSRRQIHAIAEDADAALRAVGDVRLGIEGYEASKWIVQDYGDVVVHVFDPDTRAYYALDELWADAPRVDWEKEIE
jgi:ribosome-associated protein